MIVSNTPLTPLKDIDDVALLFLTQIGYIPKGYDPKTDASSVRESVPYRLFVECLLGRLDKGWTVEQLAAKLKTTKATIYRHINKLKEMDLLDEVNVTERTTVRKGYRIRIERRDRDGELPQDGRSSRETLGAAEVTGWRMKWSRSQKGLATGSNRWRRGSERR